jgi:hypothetical protein
MKWEYKAEVLFSKEDVARHGIPTHGYQDPNDPAAGGVKLDHANGLGEEGWELFLTEVVEGRVVGFFRREVFDPRMYERPPPTPMPSSGRPRS